MVDRYGIEITAPEKKDQKSGWAERARATHGKAGEFYKKYSHQLNTTGNVALLMGGGAMLMASAVSSTPLTQGLALTSAATAIAAGCLRTANVKGGKEVATQHLSGTQNIFDVPYKKSGVTAANSGASMVSDDPIFQDSSFKKAMTSAFQQLQDDPEARSGFADMIQNSPAARRALMNAQKQIDAADELRNNAGAESPSQQAPDDREDQGPGMTMH